MKEKNVAESLTNDEISVLKSLTKVVSLSKLSSSMNETKAMRVIQWLENKGLIRTTRFAKEIVELGINGIKYRREGLPETRFLKEISKKDKTISQLEKTGLTKQEINVCIGLLKSKLAIDVRREKELTVSITKHGKKLLEKESYEEKFLKKKFPLETKELEDMDLKIYKDFSKRKDMIQTILKKDVNISLTPFGQKVLERVKKNPELIEKLTPEMLANNSWKNKTFRRYDVTTTLPRIEMGRKNFVNEAITYIRKIWLELGFEEMRGNHIQTAFWDLDSLFVPQDHPAREMQDTFYIENVEEKISPEVLEKVKKVHENGGNTGSKGWQYKFSKEETTKLLLRTHTTVLSALSIAKLKKKDLPKKYFSVNKVYRNESLDWKHLFEFYQVEGIVVDPNANLQHLKGYLREFYTKMGYSDVRMRPAHFPYTEPSVEVEVFHPVKKQWVELGGAGIFRPEVTKTLMGFECPVLAWGQGMERIITEYWKITDIRELYNNDIKKIKRMKKFVK